MQRFLGHYATDLEAARAYDRAVVELKGPDAKTNFPPPGHYAPYYPPPYPQELMQPDSQGSQFKVCEGLRAGNCEGMVRGWDECLRCSLTARAARSR